MGRHDLRPEYPTIVYTRILKQLFPDVPVVLGGIEASLRRLSHFDYWQEQLRKSILIDAGADLLIYGMGEKPNIELARRLAEGTPISEIRDIPQTVYLAQRNAIPGGIREDDIVLHSGKSPMIEHNYWPALWAKCNYEAVTEAGKLGEVVYFM